MKISKSAGYALVSAGYIAQHYKEGDVMVFLISEQYDIPLHYLLMILRKLVKVNILRSKRGRRGGFTLDRPAKEITILEIIEAIDGPMLDHVQLLEQKNNDPFILKMEKVYQSATENTKKIYGKATLAKMLRK